MHRITKGFDEIKMFRRNGKQFKIIKSQPVVNITGPDGEFADAILDRDLPQRGHAHKHRIGFGYQGAGTPPETQIIIKPPKNDLRVEQ